MVNFSTLFLALTAASASVHAAPYRHPKRIAQTTIDSTKKWEDACNTAGGGEQCNPVAVTGAGTLLAAAGACDQQNSADQMVDLAKQLNNDADMIKFAQIFAQQPRNSPTSQSVPYCQQAPKNTELNGLFQCQFQGDDAKTFVGGTAVGGTGTVPFGMSAPLDPAGSCPANPSGPIADGTQLSDQVSSPGTGSASGGGNSSSGGSSTGGGNSTTGGGDSTSGGNSTSGGDSTTGGNSTSSGDSTGSGNSTGGGDSTGSGNSTSGGDDSTSGGNNASGGGDDSSNVPPSASSAAPPASSSSPSSSGSGAGDDSGSDDDCSSDSGSPGSADVPSSTSAPAAAAAPSSSASSGSASGSGDFKLKNGQDAQALNKKFQSLDASSTCSEGDQACIDDAFAQCVGGTFTQTPCGSGLTCAALPLVNSAGTSIACTTQADAAARITASGAQGGITG